MVVSSSFCSLSGAVVTLAMMLSLAYGLVVVVVSDVAVLSAVAGAVVVAL